MSSSQPPRAARRRTRSSALVVSILVALGSFLGYRSLAVPSVAASPHVVAHLAHGPQIPLEGALPRRPLGGSHGRLGSADGVVRGGTTVFSHVPAVTNLAPDLLTALRRAATAAADSGVEFHVNSGWRSRKYQEQLLQQAISKYGSRSVAARWVATPSTSPHVSGDAIDIGDAEAVSWLSEHGARFGLCQIYDNEPWHFELRAAAVEHGCPPTYTDPTHDPRMQETS
jgi:D-alanyl-D-alanine carboxypeptidase